MDPAAIEEMYALESHHWWFVGKRLLVSALLAGVTGPRRPDILDVGCGTGGVLAHLQHDAHAIGIDRSTFALGCCRRRGIRDLACADGDRLPFAPASFDVILLLDVLEHVADEGRLLETIRTLLRPGGTLLVSVPAFQFLWSGHDEILHHLRRYTARGLRRVLERARFRVQRLTYTNAVAFPPAVVVRTLLPRIGIRRQAGTDFRLHTSWVNRALIAAYRFEAALLGRRGRLPIGVSVAAVATRSP